MQEPCMSPLFLIPSTFTVCNVYVSVKCVCLSCRESVKTFMCGV